MKETFFNSKILKGSIGFFIMLIVYYVILQLIYPYTGQDGSFYVSVGRDVFQEGIGFYSTNIKYNPLGMYILGLPYLFNMDNPIFSAYIIYFTIHLFNSVLVFFILIKLNIDLGIRYFIIVLFMLYSLFYGGVYIYLEPIELLFLLSSCLSLFHKKYLLTGFFLFLAFYTKQYALSISMAIFAYLIYKNPIQFVLKSITMVGIGFLIGLLIAFFIHFHQIDFLQFLLRLIAQTNNVEGALKPTSTGSIFLLKNLFLFFIFSNYIFFGFIFLLPKLKIDNNVLFLITSFLGLSLSLYFASYNHYFIQIFPWGLILLAIGLNNIQLSNKTILVFKISTYLTIISFGAVFGRSLYYNLPFKRYSEMLNESKKVSIHVPNGSNVFLRIDPTLYLYSDYYTANYKNLSYRFPETITLESTLKYMNSKSYMILENEDYLLNNNKFNEDFILIEKDLKYSYLKKISR